MSSYFNGRIGPEQLIPAEVNYLINMGAVLDKGAYWWSATDEITGTTYAGAVDAATGEMAGMHLADRVESLYDRVKHWDFGPTYRSSDNCNLIQAIQNQLEGRFPLHDEIAETAYRLCAELCRQDCDTCKL